MLPVGYDPFLARSAALSNSTLAHVPTLGLATALISSYSASVSFTKKAGFRFSDSGKTGRPGPLAFDMKILPLFVPNRLATDE